MRDQLRRTGVSDSVVDDAVLILSELLSNACRHGRPLGRTEIGDGDVRAAWRVDKAGRLTVEVTDGGGPTRPVPATPSVTARGGRGLNIISALAQEWGVRDNVSGEVTVWVLVTEARREERTAGGSAGGPAGGPGFPAQATPAVSAVSGFSGVPEVSELAAGFAPEMVPEPAPEFADAAEFPAVTAQFPDVAGFPESPVPDVSFPDLFDGVD